MGLIKSKSNSRDHSMMTGKGQDDVDKLEFAQKNTGLDIFGNEDNTQYVDEDDDQGKSNPIDLPYPSNSDQDGDGSMTNSERLYQDQIQQRIEEENEQRKLEQIY